MPATIIDTTPNMTAEIILIIIMVSLTVMLLIVAKALSKNLFRRTPKLYAIPTPKIKQEIICLCPEKPQDHKPKYICGQILEHKLGKKVVVINENQWRKGWTCPICEKKWTYRDKQTWVQCRVEMSVQEYYFIDEFKE